MSGFVMYVLDLSYELNKMSCNEPCINISFMEFENFNVLLNNRTAEMATKLQVTPAKTLRHSAMLQQSNDVINL